MSNEHWNTEKSENNALLRKFQGMKVISLSIVWFSHGWRCQNVSEKFLVTIFLQDSDNNNA